MKTMTAIKQTTYAARLIKAIIMLIAMAAFLTAFSGRASADKTIEVTLNETPVEFAIDPYLTEGTTLVQFRPLFEAMNMKVEWDNEQQIVTGTKEGISLTMKINSTQATVNGKVIELEQPPRIMDGHTMVPVRFVSESTGALVAWNPYKPQILIYTESYLQELGLTQEQAEEAIDKELERIKAEYEAAQTINEPVQPIPVPDVPTGSGEYKPAGSGSVDLSKLQGMYYGFSSDYGGYECGGICWHLYTFLPDNQVLVGEPPNGGPETIDCKQDNCQSYTIKDGKMILSNGESYSIGLEDGQLVIDDVELTPVEPVAADLKLSKSYIYRGYVGLGGISSGSTTWSKVIDFSEEGTFKSDSLMLGSVEGGARTQGSTGFDTSGSYRISGNTIVFAYNDGSTENLLFFVHENEKRGALEDIQIGENNYYVD